MRNLGYMIVGIGAALNAHASANKWMTICSLCFIVAGVWIVAHETFSSKD